MPQLDITKPIWARDRSTVKIVAIRNGILHAELTTPNGVMLTGTYHQDGRSTDPGSEGWLDLSNEPPPAGRCTPYRGLRYHEDI